MNDTNNDVTTETTVETIAADKASDDRGGTTTITQRTRSKQIKERAITAFLVFCGVVMLACVYHAYNVSSRANSAPSTVLDTGSMVRQSSQRKVKLVDMSRCRKDQLKIVAGDTLVSDSDCTVITYEDGK